jgi:cytochrome c biogenesis protein CcdA
MDGNRILRQMGAIFSVFMVFFYLGIGIYLAFFFEKTYLDKALRVIVGSTFIFYGLYRAYRTYLQIVEAFFTDDKNAE